MNLSITFRHLEPTDALKAFVTERSRRLERHLPAGASLHVVLDVEKRDQQRAELVLTLGGQQLIAQASTSSLYASIDAASQKLDEQVRRLHERRAKRRRAARMLDEIASVVPS